MDKFNAEAFRRAESDVTKEKELMRVLRIKGTIEKSLFGNLEKARKVAEVGEHSYTFPINKEYLLIGWRRDYYVESDLWITDDRLFRKEVSDYFTSKGFGVSFKEASEDIINVNISW